MKLLILLLTSAKLGKLAISVGSMLLTIWIYAAIYGFPFAAGFVAYLLLFVSGIPMLEKKWKGIPEWEVYKKKTSAFIPWFPQQ